MSQPAQVVGIMPPDFAFVDMTPPPDVILAVRFEPREAGWRPLSTCSRDSSGRYARRGARRPRAHAADLARPRPCRRSRSDGADHPVVRPLQDDLVGSIASALWVLMGAIGAVLLIACANIANLMLVRADARRPELAMRAALGARPQRIARELLVESLVLGAAGGVLGLLLAYVGLQGSSRSARATCRAFVRSPSIRPCSRSPWLSRSRRRSCSARSRRSSSTAHRYARHRRRPRREREPRAERDAQRFGRRAGGARARVGRERGADDSIVSGLARRRSRFLGPGDDSNGDHLDPGVAECRPRDSLQWTRTQHEILDRIAALPGVASAGFVSDASDRARRDLQLQRLCGRRPNAGGRRAAAGPIQVHLARLFRGHGHAADRGARHDLERHRRGRPRGRDFSGFRSTARGGARRRARAAHPVCRRRCRANGAR